MNIRLKKVWNFAKGFELMDVGHGFFMVKFNQEMDRMKVMNGGPWMILDHYLTVRTWSPSFVSTTAKIDWTLVWARIPDLNVVFYDEIFLLALASALGTPIKVDMNTVNVTRGKFARICIEVDLDKPVVGKVWIQNHWHNCWWEKPLVVALKHSEGIKHTVLFQEQKLTIN
jgi:hypothetical protein